MAWVTPKIDWVANPTNPVATDMNRIEGNIDYLKTDIETKKGSIVDALNTVGIVSTLGDTYAQLASKITSAEKTGISILPSTSEQAIAKGIYDTDGGVVQGDVDLVSANIKAGKNIFGVTGTLQFYQTLYKIGATYYPNWEKGICGYYSSGAIVTPSSTDIFIDVVSSTVSSFATAVTSLAIDLTNISSIMAIGISTDNYSDKDTKFGVGISSIKSTGISLPTEDYLDYVTINNVSSWQLPSTVKKVSILDVSGYTGLYYIYLIADYAGSAVKITEVTLLS